MADTCPRCGFADVQSDKCPQCGVIIAVYQASLDKMRAGPGPSPFARPNVPRAPGGAAPVAGAPAAATPFTPTAPPPPAVTAASRPAAAAPTAGSRHPIFRGSGSALFGLHVVNALLTLVTLGWYFFWAKVRVRNYLWSQTEFEGDRFAYHGTGREMLVGFLKAALFFIVPITLLNLVPELLEAPPAVQFAAKSAVFVLGAVFVPVAIVGARRYRLSRSSWRGIRFSLRASTRAFIGLWIRGWLLTSLTVGLYYPVFVTNQHRFLTSNTWFGSQRFAFDGRGRDLFWTWVGTIVLFLPTLGLSWFWFAAKRQRYFAEHTRFAGATFRSTVTAPGLAWLTVSTWIGLIFTAGLAWPWLTARTMRRGFAWLSLDGPLALDAVIQQAQQVSATGEGLAGFFDADLGVT
ncbi:MAG TPA: YjgN family protein [Methylomirabilota bacterium]|nr:YjgN family protein [Methylomirabilota bacterium]